jgi:hypothetical protein
MFDGIFDGMFDGMVDGMFDGMFDGMVDDIVDDMVDVFDISLVVGIAVKLWVEDSWVTGFMVFVSASERYFDWVSLWLSD